MNKLTIYGTLAYTFTTFPLAVIWHVALFENEYKAFGYFNGEPSFVLGFITILIQGLVLSFLFPFVKFSGTSVKRGLKYSAVLGMFFWTSHVLALLAKQTMLEPLSFALMESFYLLMQFGIYGFCIGLIFKKQLDRNA